MWSLLTFLIIGFLAGLLARAIVSGPSPKGCLPTTILGVIGSFVGGWLGYALLGKDVGEGRIQPSGIFGSIIGSIVILLIYRWYLSRNASR
jgi:uncharacterized membrane protein YeaQ/YmgE (transglycosylase-associated protein family)